MGLNYPADWKFPKSEISEDISEKAIEDFLAMATQIADTDKYVIEVFKSFFASQTGGSTTSSSSFDWAKSDLNYEMKELSKKIPAFIDAIWLSIEKLKKEKYKVPDYEYINKILSKNDIKYRIDGKNLIRLEGDAVISKIDTIKENNNKINQFGNYFIDKPIGSGGFGTVYRAIRKTTVAEFEYALKLFDPSPFNINHEKALERFKREIKAVQSLQHKSIIQYVDAGIESQGRHYLVMPLIKGENILSSLQKQSFYNRLFIFYDMLDGIKYAHKKGILHRDIKPSNVFIRESDLAPIILDFGLSYLMDDLDSSTITTTQIGSAGYIPTEVLADPKIRNEKHDIYSCGVLLYELFAGFKPDPANLLSLDQVHDQGKYVDEVVKKALAPVNKRYSKIEEFMEDIQPLFEKFTEETY